MAQELTEDQALKMREVQKIIMDLDVDAEQLNPISERLFLVRREQDGALLAIHFCEPTMIIEELEGNDPPEDHPGSIAAWIAYLPGRDPALVASCICSENALSEAEIGVMQLMTT